VNAINDGWMVKWRLNNWQSSRNEEVKNKDMWQVLYKLVYSGKIPYKIKKVKGHNGISLNELADLKAREQIKSL
jgi:ribonuclease HI